MKLTKKLIQRAINTGWVNYGEFDSERATEEVIKLLKEANILAENKNKTEKL